CAVGLPELVAVGGSAVFGAIAGGEKERAADAGEVRGKAIVRGIDVLDQRRASGTAVGAPELDAMGGAIVGAVESGEEEGAAEVLEVIGVAAARGAAVDVLDQGGVEARRGAPRLGGRRQPDRGGCGEAARDRCGAHPLTRKRRVPPSLLPRAALPTAQALPPWTLRTMYSKLSRPLWKLQVVHANRSVGGNST